MEQQTGGQSVWWWAVWFIEGKPLANLPTQKFALPSGCLALELVKPLFHLLKSKVCASGIVLEKSITSQSWGHRGSSLPPSHSQIKVNLRSRGTESEGGQRRRNASISNNHPRNRNQTLRMGRDVQCLKLHLKDSSQIFRTLRNRAISMPRDRKPIATLAYGVLPTKTSD